MSSERDDNPYRPPLADVQGEEPTEYLPATELASRWRRFWGSMLDGVLLMAVNLPIIIFLTPESWERAKTNSPSFADNVFGSVIGIVVFLAINAYTLRHRGQTLGKLALGTRIVSRNGGQLLPLGRLFTLRYGPIYLLGLVPLAAQIGALINVLFIFRADRRCLHDHIAGTIVVNVEKGAAASTDSSSG